MFKYAGIGSRTTPDEIIQLMILIAKDLSDKWILRTGYAAGADAAFHYGAEVRQGKQEIFLPWFGFNGAPDPDLDSRFHMFGSEAIQNEALEIASKFHPAWSACSPGAKLLHARNVLQIAGKEINNKVDMVVCWTKNAKRSGGTGQALRIADFLNIPIFDLANPTAFDNLVKFVDQLENPKN